ncbi:cytochrome P450 2J6-like isoform X1 [Chiroxiphia lanceolata]|uniref:cytochrome P450 2J6-like isoform X1 n=2 Tax=Chiroxiphia lanceolata TaxID=296741 RepID=UPI0013CEB6B9|nr:cytochrome P450 2J6-like isoform X1 [Chiroxiphia lanceolata]
MVTVSGVLVFFVVSLLIIQFLKLQWMRRRLPPGPTPYPFFGNLLQMNFKIHHENLKKMAKIYGNIFTLWVPNGPVVVLQGFQAVKEGLTVHAEDVAGRPTGRLFHYMSHGNGVMFSNGHLWKQQRRFGMATMRKMGVGKKTQEYRLQEEACHLVEYLQKTNGKPLDPTMPVVHAVANVICSVIFGHRFSRDDENFHRLIESIDTITAFGNSITFFVYELFPWLTSHFLGPYKETKSKLDFVKALLAKELESHKEKRKLDENRDFIDYYLAEIDKTKGDAESTYDEENLIQTIFDLFIAGTETTATTLRWALLFMVIYPDIQEKVQKELDAVLGCSHAFCYEDRKKLPYTNAVVHEIQRYSNIILIALPRLSLKDTELLGYHVPKNTIILANIDSVLSDPGKWETPDQFNPGHFLDKDGNFVNREAFLPFAIGQRVCMGELLARMELFTVFSTLLQAFMFTLPEGVKEVNTKFVFGSTMKPPPYQICAIPRF